MPPGRKGRRHVGRKASAPLIDEGMLGESPFDHQNSGPSGPENVRCIDPLHELNNIR